MEMNIGSSIWVSENNGMRRGSRHASLDDPSAAVPGRHGMQTDHKEALQRSS